MEDIPSIYLKSRKQALDRLAEVLDLKDYDIAEMAIDLYMDFLEGTAVINIGENDDTR